MSRTTSSRSCEKRTVSSRRSSKGSDCASITQRAAPARRTGASAWASRVGAGRDHRDARHNPALASSVGGPQVDVCARQWRASRTTSAPSSAGHSDGDGESDVGLYADPGCLEESRALHWPISDRAHPARAGHSAGSGASDDVAYVCASALVRAPCRRFLHD